MIVHGGWMSLPLILKNGKDAIRLITAKQRTLFLTLFFISSLFLICPPAHPDNL